VISADEEKDSRNNVFKQQFNVTHDAKLFRTETELLSESKSVRVGNSFVVNGETFLPLIEPKFFQIYDHRFGTFDGIADAEKLGRKASTRRPSIEEKVDPGFVVTPRYWVSKSEFDERLDPDWNRGYFFVYRGITNISTNARTAIGSVIPAAPHSEASPAILFYGENKAKSTIFFVANFSSYPFDYVCRQKIGGPNLNIFIVKQLPSVSLNRLATTWFLAIENFVLVRAIELIHSSWDLDDFALDCGYNGPPFRWGEDRRFQIRCELDAAYFHLYLGSRSEWGTSEREDNREVVNKTLLGMFQTPRDAVRYIMDTFPIVRRKDEAKYGEYRTKRVILEIYDQMTEIIEANEGIRAANPGKSEEELRPLLRSYQSPLNPPPGPPTDANGNFIPMAEWDPANWPWHIHPPKDDNLGIAVFRKPEQWGLRGDPYLWREIHQKFIDEGIPTDEQKFAQKVEEAFAELTGCTLNHDDSTFVERYNHGGMSSGLVDPRWWRETGIPLLRQQFQISVSRQEPAPDGSGDCK